MPSGTAEAKSYVLVSKVPTEIYSKYIEDKKTSHVTGFTFVVISIVHLAGGKISEGMPQSLCLLLGFTILWFGID